MIDRRAFVRTSTIAATGVAAGWSAIPAAGYGGSTRLRRQRADLLIRGGLVIDGSGAPGIEADVLLSGGRIARFARNIEVPAGADVIDAAGLAVAPGFIDIHSHTDTELFRFPEAHSKVRQGVTTEVAGQDGSSVAPSSTERAASAREQYSRDGITVDLATVAGFLASIDAHGAAVNLATMVGAGTLRGLVIGNEDRPASPAEIERMAAMVADAIRGGACGLSSGLEYTPGGFASREELAALALPLRGTGLPYASHMRNEDDGLFGAIEEALFVGRVAGVPVQISHLKAQGERNWWKAVVVVEMLEFARTDGIDVHFDRYPYVAYSTGLSNLFPLWSRNGGTDAFLGRLDSADADRIEQAVRDKIAQLGSWNSVQITSTGSDALSWARGRRLGELAQERGVEPYALLLELIRGDRASTGMVGFGMSEENTAFFLRHPLGMVCSDGSALATTGPQSTGTPHPRSFGTFPRVLGHYVREREDMPLETAVHKMTGMPAAKLKLAGRGTIASGAFADIVVFDPDTVADTATFEKPHAYPVGIPHVIVNGVPVIRDGEHTGARPGGAVRPAL